MWFYRKTLNKPMHIELFEYNKEQYALKIYTCYNKLLNNKQINSWRTKIISLLQ